MQASDHKTRQFFHINSFYSNWKTLCYFLRRLTSQMISATIKTPNKIAEKKPALNMPSTTSQELKNKAVTNRIIFKIDLIIPNEI